MNFGSLLALFVVVPIVELALLLRIGDMIGWPGTLVLVVVTGVVGASLARWQGVKTLLHINQDLAEGRMPAPLLLDGLMILIAGAFLITPGVITDAVGFALLVPHVRNRLKSLARSYMEQRLRAGTIDVSYREW